MARNELTAERRLTTRPPDKDQIECQGRLRQGSVDRGDAASSVSTAALSAAMNALSGMAFVIQVQPLAIVHANAAGQAARQYDERATHDLLARAVNTQYAPEIVILELGQGAEGHALVIVRPAEHVGEAVRTRAAAVWRLTPRQAQVLDLLFRGGRNKDIAAALGCSVKTVEKHVTAVLSKTGAESRAVLLPRILNLS